MTAAGITDHVAKFDSIFRPDMVGPQPPHPWTKELTRSIVGRDSPFLTEFMTTFAWPSYNRGVWRFFVPGTANFEYWTVSDEWAADWPQYRGVRLFGYDWLGRLVGVDGRPGRPSGSEVVRLEPGYGDLVLPDVSVEEFITVDLIDDYADTLSTKMYEDWLDADGSPPELDECIGYRRPLQLGGSDDVENLERTLLKVYVSICGQIVQQSGGMPDGTPIASVRSD